MADRRGRARTRAAAPFVAAVLAAALGACISAPTATPASPTAAAASSSPTVAPSPTEAATLPAATPSPASSASSGASACTAADLKASHDLVEGAAGSRLTTIVLVVARTCSVDAYPAIGLRDSKGAELIGGASAGPGRIDLDPNASYSASVQFANWCHPEPSYPVSLVVRVGAEEVKVSGTSFPEQGDMPPCNGSGGPTLEAGPWQVMP